MEKYTQNPKVLGLVVFSAIAKGITYQIIPEDRWTYPTRSDDLSAAIFGRRDQVAYLKPYTALQFNKHHYLRLTQLCNPSAGRGLDNQRIWVDISPDVTKEGSILELVGGDRTKRRIAEKPYYVKQNPGYVLGYKVVEFSKEKFPDSEPTFTAYRVALPADYVHYTTQLVDGNGKIIAGSLRELRTIKHTRPVVLFAVAFLPLFAGLVVLGLRALRTRPLKK